MQVEYVSIPNRRARSEFIARRFRPFLRGAVLDVGCDEAHLKALLADVRYTGVDVGGKPDLVVNLEKAEGLPFGNDAFDCVVCSDVLEHLDNFHHTFEELVRVARGHVILSLPNNWANARQPISRGRGSIGHYGLPLDPPVDRHKWFFSLEEASLFVERRAARMPVDVVDLFAVEKPRLVLVRALRQLRYFSRMSYLNRYAHSLWAVLHKKGTIQSSGR